MVTYTSGTKTLKISVCTTHRFSNYWLPHLLQVSTITLHAPTN